jgi:hypothetical protein
MGAAARTGRQVRRDDRVRGCATSVTRRFAVLVVGISIACSGVASAAPVTTLPVQLATVLPCTNIIDALDKLPSGYEAIGANVALPTKKVLGRGALPSGSDGYRFAKQGLFVRTGGSAELIVPPAWQERLMVGWGDAPRTTHLQVAGCGTNPLIKWVVFAGGFYVKQRGCVPLIVRAGGTDCKVHIAVGAKCPARI